MWRDLPLRSPIGRVTPQAGDAYNYRHPKGAKVEAECPDNKGVWTVWCIARAKPGIFFLPRRRKIMNND